MEKSIILFLTVLSCREFFFFYFFLDNKTFKSSLLISGVNYPLEIYNTFLFNLHIIVPNAVPQTDD